MRRLREPTKAVDGNLWYGREQHSTHEFEFLNGDLGILKYLSQNTLSQVLALMYWYRCPSVVWMPIDRMAATLTDTDKTSFSRTRMTSSGLAGVSLGNYADLIYCHFNRDRLA